VESTRPFSRGRPALEHIGFFVAVTVAAAVFALLEIEIEGDAGWAASLPTWRFENRWTRRLLGARAVTGYHVYVHLFVLLAVHLPFLIGIAAFSWRAEFRILAFLVLFWILEDFLWFVFHRAWGLKRFRRRNIPWHAESWWWFMPRDYWIFLPIGLALYAASTG
jgi:hypothetical protein